MDAFSNAIGIGLSCSCLCGVCAEHSLTYRWIVRDSKSGEVAAVDPAEPAVIKAALEERCVVAAHAHCNCKGSGEDS
jgi:hypothetical protein